MLERSASDAQRINAGKHHTDTVADDESDDQPRHSDVSESVGKINAQHHQSHTNLTNSLGYGDAHIDVGIVFGPNPKRQHYQHRDNIIEMLIE